MKEQTRQARSCLGTEAMMMESGGQVYVVFCQCCRMKMNLGKVQVLCCRKMHVSSRAFQIPVARTDLSPAQTALVIRSPEKSN